MNGGMFLWWRLPVKKVLNWGFDGYVAFTAKTDLVVHYIETLGAQVIYSRNRMGIFMSAAKKGQDRCAKDCWRNNGSEGCTITRMSFSPFSPFPDQLRQ